MDFETAVIAEEPNLTVSFIRFNWKFAIRQIKKKMM